VSWPDQEVDSVHGTEMAAIVECELVVQPGSKYSIGWLDRWEE